MSTPRNDRDGDGVADRDEHDPIVVDRTGEASVDRDGDGIADARTDDRMDDRTDDRTAVLDRDGGVTDGGTRTPAAGTPVTGTPAAAAPGTVEREVVVETPDRHEIVDRERAEHGGIKFGSAFFGWLTAMGMGVLLTAIVTAAGLAVGLSTEGEEDEVGPITITAAVVLVVILFIAYFCGGYVAGRMARFDGAKQGFAVWLWAIIAAVVAAVLGFILGSQFDVLANLDAFPRIPIRPEDATVAGIVTALILAIVSLLAAILGGLAGMRYHRRVDRTGLGA